MIARPLFDRRARPNVVVFEVPELGDRSYLLHDGEAAVVIDAQRDVEAYLAEAEALGVAIALVLETHIHNDYVSGGLALARRSGARYVVPRFEAVGFTGECDTAVDGDTFEAGSVRVRALATPGHSAHHLSYLLESPDVPETFVATGGSLLSGTTGRTDLFGAQHTSPLAVAQWRSVRRLLEECAEATIVLPTHGFGSFCAATPAVASDAGTLTIADERRRNPASLLGAEDFVAQLLAAPLPVPAYYAELGTLNRAGQPEARLGLPARASRAELEARLEDRGLVVDLRPRRIYAASHRRGTLNMEHGTNLATYLGWLVPRGEELTLLAADEATVAGAQRVLAHIGREGIAAWSLSDVALEGAAASSYPVADFAALAAARAGSAEHVLVDVRHRHEWTAGHIAGASHVALPDFAAAVPALPHDVEVWVHCGAGYRAAIAASMLESHGGRPVLVDDDFGRARAVGLPILDGNGDTARFDLVAGARSAAR